VQNLYCPSLPRDGASAAGAAPRRFLVVGLLFLIPAAAAVTGRAGAQAAQQPNGKDDETRVYYGVDSCRDCHTKGFENPDNYLCRGIEVSIWEPHDKHALAFKVLGDERARRMGKILGWDVQTKKECLTCHSVWLEGKNNSRFAEDFKREQGVSCVACHGPDVVVLPGQGKAPRIGWVDTHGAKNVEFRKAWRKLSRPEKDAAWGMTDLWDPVKRTRLCGSCHIGNAAQGKVVTHEMYAAGHPPLPGFEVVTFSNQMPRHWQYLVEKKETIQKLVEHSDVQARLEQTHLLAVGGLVALRESLNLLAAQATGEHWPEFAHFDCYACHHDLKSKSWRQERGYAGNPGRPGLREWPTALVRPGLVHAAATDQEAAKLVGEFHEQYAALQAVFDAQPFGKPEAIRQHAEKLGKWLDAQVQRIQDRSVREEAKGSYGPGATVKDLTDLYGLLERSLPQAKGTAKGQRSVPDFDSARQLAWAYHVLYLEAASRHDAAERKKIAEAMESQPAWEGLSDYLRLTLPKGQTKLEGSFSLSLERVGQYEPAVYFKHLEAALKAFPPPG
jgi:hypothetical protein